MKKEETPDKSKEESIMPQESGVYVDEKAFVREKKRHKALVIITTVLAGLFIAGYTFMVINSIFYFQPNTVINGVDYSFRTEESVQKEIDDKMSDYKLHITLRNGEITLRPEDIGLVITTKNDVHSIKEKQNPFLWFVTYFGAPDEAAYEISYDPALMESFLRNNSYFMASSMISPQNPRIVMADGVPEIRKGNPGTLIDMERFREVLDEKLQHLDTEFRPDSEGCYVNAEYTEDSPEVKGLQRSDRILYGSEDDLCFCRDEDPRNRRADLLHAGSGSRKIQLHGFPRQGKTVRVGFCRRS